ncbi:MAG TPA: DUF2971 domain-containing protein [Bacteroidia bacterium]|nr:DUF2971 domain-containing protein [Bacteroidia bacterium]
MTATLKSSKTITEDMPNKDFDPFLKSGDVPEVMYKYRNWSNQYDRRTLTDFELFQSSPSRFNDPYDCKIPVAYFLLEHDKEKQQRYFTRIVNNHKAHLSDEEKILEVQRLIMEGRFTDHAWLKWADEDFLKQLNNKYGIVSLTPVKDNVLMWAHYANSQQGYCIGFRSTELFNNPDHFGSGGKVQYHEKYPLIDPEEEHMQQMIKQVYLKSKVWEYEQEYRLSKFEAADRVIDFDRGCVAEILIGCNASRQTIEEIRDVASRNFPKVPIFVAFPERYNYKISFDKL